MNQKEKFLNELQLYYGVLCVRFRDWHTGAQIETGPPNELERELQLIEALIDFHRPGNDGMGVGVANVSMKISNDDNMMFFTGEAAAGIADGRPA